MNQILAQLKKTAALAREVSAAVRKNDEVQRKVKWFGIPIDIEWVNGQKRQYENVPDIEQKPLHAHYGYIRGTETEDGEEMDVYLKPGSEVQSVHMIIQLDKAGNYDEIKYMLGFSSMEEAKSVYLWSMPYWMFGGIFKMPWEKFTDDHMPIYEE